MKMRFDAARGYLLEREREVKKELVGLMQSGDRNFEKQRMLFATYEEFLSAADVLLEYENFMEAKKEAGRGKQ